MARYYQRPENALKKATEFIEVGKPTRALDTLYDVIKGKKHRAFSEKVIEPIMLKYLELCVDLKKPHTAKEGLYQYRLMCQSVNVGLLEKVIRSYIKMAEDRTELARDSLKSKVLLDQCQQDIADVDDLDNLSMAEMTLLNVITEEQAQERSERAALIPWVKFLWESYTQCLDLLRNNARLESLYHDIAQMAFRFCLSYARKTEFRKLCERLRKHFDDIVNRSNTQVNSIDFSSPETQQLNMETRLSQLDSAITMELWQEAYKAIEDIHLLMNQSKKSQTRMMAYYYQKLSLVFWKAGNLLFHAATLLKYYILLKDMKKNLSQEELQKNASQVVMATLAIPFPVVHPEFERFVETEKGMMEKAQKLATLLFLPSPPTRASMIRDLTRFGVLANATPRLQDLHNYLETEFNPLELCENVSQRALTIVQDPENEYLKDYIEPMKDVTLVRFIKQISQVYQSIDYDHFLSLTAFTTQFHLEQVLVDMVRYSDMQITIDHRENCVRFGTSVTESSREEQYEGPRLQDMPSEFVRMQLVNVFSHLESAIEAINPDHVSIIEEKLRSKIYSQYLLTAKQTHIQLLQRQKIIADRREELERSAADRENEEKWRSEQVAKQQIILEQKRLESEREERERKRVEVEKLEVQQQRNRDKVKQIINTPFGKSMAHKFKDEDLEKLDVETVMQRQQEEMAKEVKEHITRMRAQEKRLDHLERAKRLEEIPVIEKYMSEKKQLEKQEWELHEKERITHLIEDRKIAVANRDRMKRMRGDKDTFLSKLLESRRHVFVAKLSEFEKRLADEKAKRLAERKQERHDDRRRKYFQEKEEEERRKQEALQLEEEERLREEHERLEKETADRNRITFEKQKAKEREIEEREKERRQAAGPASVTPAAEPWRPRHRKAEAAEERPSLSNSNTAPTPAVAPTAAAAAAAPPAKTGWVPPSKAKRMGMNVENLDGSDGPKESFASKDRFKDDRDEDGGRRPLERSSDADYGRRERGGEWSREVDRGRDRDERGGGYERAGGGGRGGFNDTQGEDSWRTARSGGGDRRGDGFTSGSRGDRSGDGGGGYGRERERDGGGGSYRRDDRRMDDRRMDDRRPDDRRMDDRRPDDRRPDDRRPDDRRPDDRYTDDRRTDDRRPDDRRMDDRKQDDRRDRDFGGDDGNWRRPAVKKDP